MTILDAFDILSGEVIRASHMVKPVKGFPPVVVSTYSRIKFHYILNHYPCTKIAVLNTSCMTVPVYRIDHEGGSFALYLSLIGAPAAAILLEEAIALGGRRFLFFGSCGVLDNEILAGHIAVPVAAYRDEGTSYHYLAPSPYVDIPTAAELAAILQDLQVPYHLTRTWTTDAIYRETRGNMAKRLAEGCRVVEMECAATAAIAQFRQVEFYQFVYGADSLDGDDWEPRSLIESIDEEGGAIANLAVSIARRLIEATPEPHDSETHPADTVV